MNKKERKNRIIARGEHSDHCHVITGRAIIERKKDKVFINVEDSTAVIKHLLESKWIEGLEQWTNEHTDITLDCKGSVRHGDVLLKQTGPKQYEYIQQQEYDPFDEIVRQVLD